MRPTPTGILVLGAAGSGTTTLGRALAAHRGLAHVDLDDVLWQRTDPPYTALNPPAERARALRAALEGLPAWVISGSPGAWSDFLLPDLALVVFLQAPAPVRIARLRQREAARFGAAIEPGQPQHARHVAFLAWAAAYEADPTVGRSLRGHEAWLAALAAPVVRLDATRSCDDLVRTVLDRLAPAG